MKWKRVSFSISTRKLLKRRHKKKGRLRDSRIWRMKTKMIPWLSCKRRSLIRQFSRLISLRSSKNTFKLISLLSDLPLTIKPKGLNLFWHRTLRSLSGFLGFIFGCIGTRTNWISTSTRWNFTRRWTMMRSTRRIRIPSCRLTSWWLKRSSRSNGIKRD